jgi:serine phosphatase RsbU (regulator of sigma subunit)/Tfp pilus assembly protein PilF
MNKFYTNTSKIIIKNLFLLLLSVFTFQIAYPQKELQKSIGNALNKEQQKSDSLLTVIQKTKNDTLRADLYFEYFELSWESEWIKYAPLIIKSTDYLLVNKAITAPLRKALLSRKAMAIRYCYYYYNKTEGSGSKKGIALLNDAIKIFAEIGNDAELTQTYINLADDYFRQGNLFKQYQTLEEGLKTETDRKFNRGISRFYAQLQLFYANMGDTIQVIDYLDKAIKLEKEINDSTRLANGYYLAGLTYSKMLKHQKAIDYLLLSIKSYENKNMQNRERNLSRACLLLGDEYMSINNFDKALDVFNKTIDSAKKSEDVRTIFLGTLAKGKTMSLKGKFNEAVKIHNEILKVVIDIGKENEAPGGMCRTELAQDYYRHGDYPKAKEYIEYALEIAKKEHAAIVDLFNNVQIAYQIDSAGNYFEDAFNQYQQYIILKEKLNKEEALKLAAKDRFNSEIKAQKTEQEKKDILLRKEIEQQKVVRNSFVGGFVLMLLFAGVSYRNFRRKKKDNKIITQQKTEVENQKHLVEEKNREILDSIEYALRIQTAILPPQKIVKQYLENSFILYKPKDIVAGDFYWMEIVNDLVLFAACDCTGHGVPGAMVSVVCHNALNRAVREFGLTQPAAILDKTAEIVIENFSKSEEDIKDGMDISLCTYNAKTKTIQWAGANNPLWLLQHGELIETKADKQPIGMNEDSKPFTNHTFTLNNGDTIYLFTDGFADQFGGDTGEKKLTKRRFKDLLLSIQTKSLQEQETALDKFIVEYRKEIEQIDDILVMGVKV